MNAFEFNELIENYDPLSEAEIEKFLFISGQFPYFQLPRFLYTKALKEQKSKQFKKALNRLALHTFDRSVLKKALEIKLQSKIKMPPTPALVESSVDTIENTTEEATAKDKVKTATVEVSMRSKEEAIHQGEKKLSFTDWIINTNNNKIKNRQENSKEEKKPIDDKLSIINRFIENDPKISPIEKTENSSVKISINDYTDELMTETLAKVLVKQKKYKKAISAYRILSLKYPEKNVFFAGRIQDIKNLPQ